jgi:hypothetical protein
MTQNVTLEGVGAVTLTVVGQTIEIAVTGVTPAPPSSVSVSPGNNAVTASYLIGSGGATANIYRATSGSFSAATLIGSTGAGPYIDNTAVNGTEYWYWLTSVSSTGLESSPTGPYTATPSPYLLYDTFALNTGTLSGRSVEQGSALPQTWTVYDGAFTVGSGYLTCTSTSGDAVAYANAENANASVSAQVVIPAGTSNTFQDGIVGRVADGGDLWLMLIDNKGPSSPWGRVNLYERNSGSYTLRSSVLGLTFTPGSTVTLKMSFSGAAITCYLNGTSVLMYSSTDLESATGFGVRGYVDGTGSNLTPEWKAFTVTTP